jgi:hypothetical protein
MSRQKLLIPYFQKQPKNYPITMNNRMVDGAQKTNKTINFKKRVVYVGI